MRPNTLLVVSLTRRSPPLARQVEAAVQAGADAIELRVDLIDDVEAVKTLLGAPHPVPYILTVRGRAEGGAWSGDELSRYMLLGQLANYRPAFVDLELAMWEQAEAGRRWFQNYGNTDAPSQEEERYSGTLILSHHNLSGTPAGLDRVFDRWSAAAPAGVIKAVFTARDALDSMRVLEQLHRRSGNWRMIALAMGEAGLSTRVLARKFGGMLTFATLERGTESAPGQPTVDELRNVYRWDTIGRSTRVFGVVGWPVTHSRGPQLHNAAMAAGGIDGVYLPLPVKPDYADLAAFLDYATNNDWLDLAGVSVTLPHKENVTRWLAQRGFPTSELARRCGAVNTLAREPDGRWRGENTDAAGAVRALETLPELAGRALNGETVDVLGAGGVARAVVAALLERGCHVTVYNRSEQRAQALAAKLDCIGGPWDQRDAGTGHILVNCTSVGMTPDVDVSPVSADRLVPGTVVFDTIYNPVDTRLLRDARARGCPTVSGLEMFLAQAARQYELWHGQAAPMDVLRRTMDAAS